VQWFHLYEINDETVASVLASIDTVFPAYRVYLSSNTDIVVVAGAAAPLRQPDWSLLEAPTIREDLRRFTSLTPETIEAAEIGERESLHGYLAHVAINSDFRPVLDLNGERLRFEKEYASGFEDLGEMRLDVPAAIEGRKRSFGTLTINPTPEIHRAAALVEGKQFRDALAGLMAETPTDDSFRNRLTALRAFYQSLSGTTAPHQWTAWVSDFVRADSSLQGGTAGVADERFYRDVERFLDATKAPPAVRSAVAFYHGVAAWDFNEVSRAGDALVGELDAKRTWIPEETLRIGTVLAKAKLGDIVGARATYERLKPDAPTVADQVLTGWIDDGSPPRG
jgi:hypothetical protein